MSPGFTVRFGYEIFDKDIQEKRFIRTRRFDLSESVLKEAPEYKTNFVEDPLTLETASKYILGPWTHLVCCSLKVNACLSSV